MSAFYTQGSVPFGSPAYVEREFERNVTQSVFAARWALVLGPRQHGKTTGLMRVSKQLENSGFLSAFVDLQGLVVLCKSYEELLETFTQKIAERLSLALQEKPIETHARHLIYWLEKIIPPGKQPVIIIIDEASAIENEEWRNAFYSQIRSIKNEQAMAKEDDLVNRLRFVFSGCFRPETLVQTLNSPFNTCEEIFTEDLSFAQAEELYRKVTGITDVELIQTIFDFVGGNPYLLQAVFDKIQSATKEEKELSLANALNLLRTGQDGHFQNLFQRLHEDENLRELVSEMTENSSVANDPADTNSKFLRTLGLAKLDGKSLVFRNQLYKSFAENSTLFRHEDKKEGHAPQIYAEQLSLGGFTEMKSIKVDVSHSKIEGNFVISDVIKDSFKTIETTDTSDEMKKILFQLGSAVEEMAKNLTKELAEEVIEDYKKQQKI